MASEHATYTHGPLFRPTRPITGQILLDTCHALEKAFNTKHNTDVYKFEPERISEGGIEWINWPGKTTEMYKTMRIYFSDYPWVDKIEQDPLIVIDQRGSRPYGPATCHRKESPWMGTYLKAFHSAPKWTADELDIFIIEFSKIGMVLTPYKKEQTKLVRVRTSPETQILKNEIKIHILNQKISGIYNEIRDIEQANLMLLD